MLQNHHQQKSLKKDGFGKMKSCDKQPAAASQECDFIFCSLGKYK
jgi:hypothetical protein